MRQDLPEDHEANEISDVTCEGERERTARSDAVDRQTYELVCA